MDVYALRVLSGALTCQASCPHCRYHRGHEGKAPDPFDFQAFRRARRYALQSGAVSMEIEAKGDPLADEWTKLYQILSEAADDFPQIGLTTPGGRILEAQDAFLNLIGWHLTNITLTIPHHEPRKRQSLLGLAVDYRSLVAYLREECHVVVRAACVLSRAGISSPGEALDFVHWCRTTGIQQVVFREMAIPNTGPDQKVAQWCLEHTVELDFHETWNFDDAVQRVFYVNSLVGPNQAHPIFVFPWGETAYEIDGVNVVFEKSDDSYYGKPIKALVLSGGHLYARWESEGTIIF